MRRYFAVLLVSVLLLTGCGMSGMSYSHVVPHSGRTEGNTGGSAPAESYSELQSALREMIENGTENGLIYTLRMEPTDISQNFAIIARTIQEEDPLGAYAVDSISYEVGTTGGKTAVAVAVSYRHGAVELRRILHLGSGNQVTKAVTEALEDCRPNMVMYIRDYENVDFHQLVRDIAWENPQLVMELPEVTEGIYGIGEDRVVELSFSYQNSRESLRQMQSQVRPVFDSAALYVSGEGSENQKLSQLYAFLMERFSYTVETSITPAYSLLHHGVGDSRAFASVYAAMCRRAGLECMTVTGARNGDPWTWNIVREGDRYCHVDLLASYEHGQLRKLTDSEMTGYVWDYSAYPACEALILPEEA